MALITIKAHTVPEYEDYLESYVGRAVLGATFLHHCWKPNAADFRGLTTMEGVRRAQMSRPRDPASDIMCNCYAGSDGLVYNARPPTTNNCACQYPDTAPEHWPSALRKLSSDDPHWMNKYGFSVETVGCFDWDHPGAPRSEDPTTSLAMRTSLDVLAIVHRLFHIPVDHCFFHRDVSTKTCPGERVSKAWVHAEIARRMNMPDVSPWAKPAVDWAREKGLMVGEPDGLFHGTAPVTREQLAVVLKRLDDQKQN